MIKVYLLLGTNLGNRSANLQQARQLIADKCGQINLHSSIYETAAWGKTDQDNFYNQAIAITTQLGPLPLLKAVKAIEGNLGRKASEKWGPRVIDIDILFYDGEIVDLPELQIPHPYLHQRRFTLVPLAEIGAAVIHPLLGKTMLQLLQQCSDTSAVWPAVL